jgi:hypothetical protein
LVGHWDVLAAQAIAERVKAKLAAAPPRREYTTEWKDAAISGDLAALLAPNVAKPSAETIALRLISEKGAAPP